MSTSTSASREKPVIFIVFAPGLGGNHVSNLVTLNQDDVQGHFDCTTSAAYRAEVLNQYCYFTENAHLDPYHNGDYRRIEQLESRIQRDPRATVICMHIRRMWELLKPYSPRAVTWMRPQHIVIITTPRTNRLALARWSWTMRQLRYRYSLTEDSQTRTYEETQGSSQFDNENLQAYTIENVRQILEEQCDYDAGEVTYTEWSSDRIFDEDGVDYIDQAAQETWGFEPLSIVGTTAQAQAQAREIHARWRGMIEEKLQTSPEDLAPQEHELVPITTFEAAENMVEPQLKPRSTVVELPPLSQFESQILERYAREGQQQQSQLLPPPQQPQPSTQEQQRQQLAQLLQEPLALPPIDPRWQAKYTRDYSNLVLPPPRPEQAIDKSDYARDYTTIVIPPPPKPPSPPPPQQPQRRVMWWQR